MTYGPKYVLGVFDRADFRGQFLLDLPLFIFLSRHHLSSNLLKTGYTTPIFRVEFEKKFKIKIEATLLVAIDGFLKKNRILTLLHSI